jgi:hypothetical protein
MIPYERDLYIGMVNNWVKDESERMKQKSLREQQDLKAMFRRNKKKR